MAKGRASVTRRKSDQMLLEATRFHRAVIDVLRGKEGDFDEVLNRIQKLGINLGRREEDRRLARDFHKALVEIVRLLRESRLIGGSPRRVHLKKVMGEAKDEFPVGTDKLGWEVEPPKLGKRYCLYMDNGKVFRTSQVEQIGIDHFQTRHSVYGIEVLKQSSFQSREEK